MSKRITLGLICVASLLAASLSAAAAPAQGLSVWVKAMDPDNDGTLDLAEIKKAAEAKFDRLEKDSDGTLDRKEVRGLGLSKAEFSKADPDKDGTLDKAEYLAIVEARFNAANPDKDGTLDLKELRSAAGQALLKLVK